MSEGIIGNLYSIKTLPNTASELVDAIYKQKDLSRKEAREMAAYLDRRYKGDSLSYIVKVSRVVPVGEKDNAYEQSEEVYEQRIDDLPKPRLVAIIEAVNGDLK